MSQTIRFSLFSSAADNQPKTQELPLGSFIESLTGEPELSDQKESGEAWSPAFYPDGATRRKENVSGLSCLGLDFDRGRDGQKGLDDLDSEALFEWLADKQLLFVAHNSYSSGAVYPREKLRLVLFFDRVVSPTEYKQIWEGVYSELPVKPDKACSDATRIYFSPRIPPAHKKYYQANTDGTKLLEVSRYIKKLPSLNEAREQRDWRQELRTTKEKHNTLVRAAWWFGCEGARLGFSEDRTIAFAWEECQRELEKNSEPVKDWAAAEKTCRTQAKAGFAQEKQQADLTTAAVESFKPTEKMTAAATAALRKEIKLVESDYGQLSNASYRLGRYCPHVLATEHVKKELFKAATQSDRGGGADGFVTATEANAAIDSGVAKGQKNPLFIYPGWKSQLIVDAEKGTLLICDENAGLVFARHPETEGLLRWNVRKGKPFFCYAPPWPTHKTEFPAPVEDVDALDAGRWLAKQLGRPLASMERTLNALNTVAQRNTWDPFLEWLESLRWDGQARLDSWLHKVTGVEDNPYHRLVGSKWVLSAVARTLTPGCDAQHVLVLVGKQGIGKSRAFRELCGSEFFCSNIGDINKEDAIFNLEKYVIVELAELAAFRRAEMETIKRFISDSSEDLRRKYARNSSEIVRRAIFGGSTNVKEFLNDPTGNRRFWPVLCRGELDLNWLHENRSQLWAEAYERVRRGEQWWPDSIQKLLCADGIDMYVDTDELVNELEFFRCEFKQWPLHVQGEVGLLDGQLDTTTRRFKWVTVKQVHLIAGTDAASRADQMRVAKMCTQLGWEKSVRLINNRTSRIWILQPTT